MGARYLFVMFEGGGNVPVQLGLARQLIERGHSVRVLGCAGVEEEAQAAGCEFRPFRHAPHQSMRDPARDPVRDWEVKNPLSQFARIARGLFFGPAALHARDVLEALNEWPADGLAVDYLLFGAQVAAERSGLPTAVLMHTPYALPGKGVPPPGLGFRPGRGPLGRLRDRTFWALTVHLFQRWGLAPLNAARAAHGLEPLGRVFQQSDFARRVLVMTSAAFDYPITGLHPNVRWVGPQLDDPTWAAPWTNPWPDDHPHPLVLVTLGSTFQNQAAILRRIVEALGGLPVRGLVTLGAVPDDDLPAPANVHVVQSAPHSAVLPQSDLVVSHAGHGTVIKSLAAGVPVICLPLGRDQMDNARRAEVAGAGLRLKASASAGAIRRAVGRALATPGFKAAAQRLGREIRRDAAQQRGAAELEGLTAGP